MKTIKGYDEVEVVNLMIDPLASRAFKPHPTKPFLTQISPAYTRERLTKVFGLCGIGWGLDWDPMGTQQFETKTSSNKVRYHFAILQAKFWYKMIDEEGNVVIITIPVTGHSDNDNLADAMSGARTSAIGQGAKELLFQLHIYKDQPPPKKEKTEKANTHWSEVEENREKMATILADKGIAIENFFIACEAKDWGDMTKFEGTGTEAVAKTQEYIKEIEGIVAENEAN